MCYNNCDNCLFSFSPKPNRANQPKAKEMRFSNNGRIESAKMKIYSDAFYEITEGKYKGNLVHVWDIVK